MHAPRSLFDLPARPAPPKKGALKKFAELSALELSAPFDAKCDALLTEIIGIIDDARAPVLALAARIVRILESTSTDAIRASLMAVAFRELETNIPDAIRDAIWSRMQRIGEIVQRETQSEIVARRSADKIAQDLSERAFRSVTDAIETSAHASSTAQMDMQTATVRGALVGGAIGAAIGGVGSKLLKTKSDWRSHALTLGVQGAAESVNIYNVAAGEALDRSRNELNNVFFALNNAVFDLAREAWSLIDPSGKSDAACAQAVGLKLLASDREFLTSENEAMIGMINVFPHLRYCATPTSGVWSFLFSTAGVKDLLLFVLAFIATSIAAGILSPQMMAPSYDGAYVTMAGLFGLFGVICWWAIRRSWREWSNRYNTTSPKRSEVLRLTAVVFREANELPSGISIKSSACPIRPIKPKNGEAAFNTFALVACSLAIALGYGVYSLNV